VQVYGSRGELLASALFGGAAGVEVYLDTVRWSAAQAEVAAGAEWEAEYAAASG
jgi:hypothetical protein